VWRFADASRFFRNSTQKGFARKIDNYRARLGIIDRQRRLAMATDYVAGARLQSHGRGFGRLGGLSFRGERDSSCGLAGGNRHLPSRPAHPVVGAKDRRAAHAIIDSDGLRDGGGSAHRVSRSLSSVDRSWRNGYPHSYWNRCWCWAG
jgi:hypothetical protein